MNVRRIFIIFSFLFSVAVTAFPPSEARPIGTYVHNEIPVPVVGPESLAFDCRGVIYTGVADGRIFKKIVGPQYTWVEFATTSRSRPRSCDGSTNKDREPECGRPLGLKFNCATSELYITDAYFGLLKVGPNGGVAQTLATSAEGVPFRFTNSLDIDPVSGSVYFTDTSTIYQRRHWESSFNSGDRTGRLMRYNPYTRDVDVLVRGLAFANGVALSADQSFVLVTQTTQRNILRHWIRGPRGNVEVFASTQGLPDNINRNIRGEFWVAENNHGQGKAANFDARGHFIRMVDGLNPISHAQEYRGNLWIGSLVNPFVGRIRLI